MRSPPSLPILLSTIVLLAGCAPDEVGLASGAEAIETDHCHLGGAGAIGSDTFGGDVQDATGVTGAWAHEATAGFLDADATRIHCRINGSRVADVDGVGTWNGVPGHIMRLHVQDRGTQTIERVPGTTGSETLTASRTYCPDRATDDAASWDEGAAVTVPATIPVTVGNAGDGTVELTFVEHETGEPIRCTYESSAGGTVYALEHCERRGDDEGDGHHGRGRGHHSHGRGHGWGHLRHGCGDGWVVDPSIVAGSVIEASSVELHVAGGSSRHPTRRDPRTEVSVALSVTPYVLETIGEPDLYRLDVFAPTGGPAIYSISGDLTSGDLTVSLL